MPLFSSSASAASLARLPAFLRNDQAAQIPTYNKLFSHLNHLERQRGQAALAPSSPFCLVQGLQDSTRDLNRYSDILPYHHSQVPVGMGQQQLATNSLIPAHAFLNANRISAPASLSSSLPVDWRGYIATQAPLPQTQTRFWRMVKEQNVHVIVCLTAVSADRTRRAQKAERYWPLAGETDQMDQDLWIRSMDKADSQERVVYRHFELWDPQQDQSQPRRPILLVHYQGWPDHGVPSKTNELLDILFHIRAWKGEQQQQGTGVQKQDFGPMVVHCSAGCGRTGTFCVVDTALSVLEHVGYPFLIPSTAHASLGRNGDDGQGRERGQGPRDRYDWQGDRDIIHEALSSFREDRMLMVQTAAQYSFCYQAVRDLCDSTAN